MARERMITDVWGDAWRVEARRAEGACPIYLGRPARWRRQGSTIIMTRQLADYLASMRHRLDRHA